MLSDQSCTTNFVEFQVPSEQNTSEFCFEKFPEIKWKCFEKISRKNNPQIAQN